jgi:predicted Rossmann fold flavoprotein
MIKRDWELIVVGAGAAGLFAAAAAREAGANVLLIEKNKKTGVKILMSGGTRCNLTQDTDWRGIASAFGGAQARFLKFSLASFTPSDTIAFFEIAGVRTKTESTGKVFPVSNRAIDVRDALVDVATDAGVEIVNGTAVTEIQKSGIGFRLLSSKGDLECQRLIVTTGGQSYPGCGTSGDGYQWLKQLGHRIIAPRPALTPIRVNQQWVRDLSGVTIPDTRVTVRFGDQPHRFSPQLRNGDRGSFLFTHRGCSGPAILNVSRSVTDPANNQRKSLVCDWLPEIDEREIRDRLAPDGSGNQRLGTALCELLPRRLVEALCHQANIDFAQSLAELGRRRTGIIADQIKRCEMAIDGTLGFAKAEVTAGGVSLEEIDPLTMASRIVPGLFLAGEILDIDGPIGGYNFQAAWSTGRLAGLTAAKTTTSQIRERPV